MRLTRKEKEKEGAHGQARASHIALEGEGLALDVELDQSVEVKDLILELDVHACESEEK